MKDNRPVNLDLGTISLPIPALVSILHRISGIILVAGMVLLLWMLDASLASQERFAQLATLLESSMPFRLVLWLVLAALIYHTLAGVRHLLMDMGIGESLEGGRRGAKIVLAAFVLLTLIAGAWIW